MQIREGSWLGVPVRVARVSFTGELQYEISVQARYAELRDDPAEVQRVLRVGAERAESQAAAVLDRAQRAIGLLPR